MNTALTDVNYQPPATTYKSENRLQQPLYTALQLWRETVDAALSTNNDPTFNVYSQKKVSHCLEMIAHTFYMSQRVSWHCAIYIRAYLIFNNCHIRIDYVFHTYPTHKK